MAKYKLKASQVVEMGRRYKNWQEKSKLGTREQMWDFHWAAGYNNYTIWAILYNDYIKRNYQGQPWCAMYGADIMVLSLMEYCGMSTTDAVEAAKDLYGGDLPYNCQKFVNDNYGDERLNHTPGKGAAVIFWTGKKYGHWGTVTSVDSNGKGYTSVEGNTSGGENKVDPDGGAVVEKWHKLDSNTLFWHPDYLAEDAKEELIMYDVEAGEEGLRVTAEALFVRSYPADGKKLGALSNGKAVYPKKKCFVDGKPWYLIKYKGEDGWISARFLEGWVLEECGLKWYVMTGYSFAVSDWLEINGTWYYFDNTGYMVSSRWILHEGKYYYLTADGTMARNAYVKSTVKELYYLVGDDGVWDEKQDTETPDYDKYPLVV